MKIFPFIICGSYSFVLRWSQTKDPFWWNTYSKTSNQITGHIFGFSCFKNEGKYKGYEFVFGRLAFSIMKDLT